jgi:hypothetical protein
LDRSSHAGTPLTSTPVKNSKRCREEPSTSQFEPPSKRKHVNKTVRPKNEQMLSKLHEMLAESPGRRIDAMKIM